MAMDVPRPGDPARPFRLPAAQGGEVALDDFRGRSPVILWFTKGMACPFCRQQMSQLGRAYPTLKARDAEVLEVTSSTPARAQFYARQFTLPFPYLCDPDYRVSAEWGLQTRRHGPGYYARNLLTGMTRPKPPNDFGTFGPSPTEVPRLLRDDDFGLFIVDRAGIVRYALVGAYFTEAHGLPGPDQLLAELDRCAPAG